MAIPSKRLGAVTEDSFSGPSVSDLMEKTFRQHMAQQAAAGGPDLPQSGLVTGASLGIARHVPHNLSMLASAQAAMAQAQVNAAAQVPQVNAAALAQRNAIQGYHYDFAAGMMRRLKSTIEERIEKTSLQEVLDDVMSLAPSDIEEVRTRVDALTSRCTIQGVGLMFYISNEVEMSLVSQKLLSFSAAASLALGAGGKFSAVWVDPTRTININPMRHLSPVRVAAMNLEGDVTTISHDEKTAAVYKMMVASLREIGVGRVIPAFVAFTEIAALVVSLTDLARSKREQEQARKEAEHRLSFQGSRFYSPPESLTADSEIWSPAIRKALDGKGLSEKTILNAVKMLFSAKPRLTKEK